MEMSQNNMEGNDAAAGIAGTGTIICNKIIIGNNDDDHHNCTTTTTTGINVDNLLAMSTLTCKVQYMNDIDPFSACTKFPEPTRPPLFTFNVNIPLIKQIASIHRLLKAPHRVRNLATNIHPSIHSYCFNPFNPFNHLFI